MMQFKERAILEEMDVQEGCVLFRVVICCSGGLYGYSGGLNVEEKNDVFSGH